MQYVKHSSYLVIANALNFKTSHRNNSCQTVTGCMVPLPMQSYIFRTMPKQTMKFINPKVVFILKRVCQNDTKTSLSGIFSKSG